MPPIVNQSNDPAEERSPARATAARPRPAPTRTAAATARACRCWSSRLGRGELGRPPGHRPDLDPALHRGQLEPGPDRKPVDGCKGRLARRHVQLRGSPSHEQADPQPGHGRGRAQTRLITNRPASPAGLAGRFHVPVTRPRCQPRARAQRPRAGRRRAIRNGVLTWRTRPRRGCAAQQRPPAPPPGDRRARRPHR